MRKIFGQVGALAWNILLVYICYMVCRLIFVFDNWDSFNYLTFQDTIGLCTGGLLFDSSAIAYSNIIYILLILFPLHFKENRSYHNVAKWCFIIINSLMIVANLVDSAYFPFSAQRTTTSIFAQFSNEDNLVGIFAIEAVRSWYLVLSGGIMMYCLYRFYRNPMQENPDLKLYYPASLITLVIFGFAAFCGMRGGWGISVRPITLSNANQFTKRPAEASIVLNTPFSVIRTIGKKPFEPLEYFADRIEMQDIYSPVHKPDSSSTFTPKNVVQIILESNSLEYYGRGYTPFLDSLANESLTYTLAFANGRISIDAMASILSSIPRMGESFILTPSSLNPLTSVAGELGRNKGYHTAFFHGAQESSMGFKAYSNSVGYKEYYGRESFGNDEHFDGHWSIWDEEFLQFYADKISTFNQPFATAIFTATSHHPYIIPERYMDKFEDGTLPIHKCIAYTDMSVRRFFENASRQDWYDNTIFVICADHTNAVEFPEYGTEAGRYMIPLMFYTPDGSLKAKRKGTIQQIDIMPTILGLLGYDQEYIAFGNDLSKKPESTTFAVNSNNGIYQIFMNEKMLQFNGEQVIAIYNYVTDPLLENNLLGKSDKQIIMEKILKSFLQQYMERMISSDGLIR